MLYLARTTQEFKTRMIATFFVLYLIILLALVLACKSKGLIHLLNLGLLIIADILVIVWEYRDWPIEHKLTHEKRTRKAAGYFMFFASITIWLTGVGKFINEIFQNDLIPMIKPDL